ncbi:MAG: EamA family transporter [Desulfuromonadaceae bacterium]|nr:EamA family transporter [Desulfuromonadaceae bacterium]MDD5107219.1 EamA family transporter [Desulfuromonadaceae bacterium]
MSQGVYFALLSMIFAGVYDVVCKKYSARERSRGMYVLGIGVTWAGMQLLWMRMNDVPFHTETATISYSLIAGVLLTLSNLLLIEGLTHINVSLGSTVYRLNTIGVIILSYLVLHESVGQMKLTGIIIGIIAVLLMYGAGKTLNTHEKSRIFFWIVVCASLCRALYGIVSKAGLSAQADAQSMLLIVALCWVVGGALYAKCIEKRFMVTRKKAAYSALSGFLVFCIVNFLIQGLKTAEASIVIPIANMSFVVALCISLVLKMETLTVRKSLAACMAAFSILLLFNA